MHTSLTRTLRAAASAAAICGFVALVGCGPSAPPTPQSEAMFAFMNDEMQVRAEVIWDSAGYIISAEGERDLSPTTDEGWEEVRQGALAIVEAGEALKSPPYAFDDDNWNAFADGIIAAGHAAEEGAVAQDSDVIFEVGGQLYRVCLACHQFYRVGEYAPAE